MANCVDLLLQMKFYGNRATLICLHVSAFTLNSRAEQSRQTEWPAKPKYRLSGPRAESLLISSGHCYPPSLLYKRSSITCTAYFSGLTSQHCVSTSFVWIQLQRTTCTSPKSSEHKRESRLVASDSLRPHGLYSRWNSPDHNTGV